MWVSMKRRVQRSGCRLRMLCPRFARFNEKKSATYAQSPRRSLHSTPRFNEKKSAT